MVCAGILPWTLFSTGLSEASNSLVNNEKLIGKVYFPRRGVCEFPDQPLYSARVDGVVPIPA
jgi:hypothetical protein